MVNPQKANHYMYTQNVILKIIVRTHKIFEYILIIYICAYYTQNCMCKCSEPEARINRYGNFYRVRIQVGSSSSNSVPHDLLPLPYIES